MIATIDGMDKLLAKLADLGSEDGNFAKKAIRRSLREGGKVLQSRLIADAPSESGNLKAKVKVRAMKRARNITGIYVGWMAGTLGNTFYAGLAMFGHGKHRIPKSQSWGPRAFQRSLGAIKQRIAEVLTEEISRYYESQ